MCLCGGWSHEALHLGWLLRKLRTVGGTKINNLSWASKKMSEASTAHALSQNENSKLDTASAPVDIASAMQVMRVQSTLDEGSVAFSQSAGRLPIHQSIDLHHPLPSPGID